MLRAIITCVSVAVPTLVIPSRGFPAESTPATASAGEPVGPIDKLTATCIRVKGSVQYAPLDAKSTDAQVWKPVEVGGQYGQGLQIRTGIRSSVVLKFGDDTVVMIDRSTLAAISEFYKTAATKRIRIGLDYGTVRAGVAEGELRSDFAIDSPVATLSKRGTWDFEMWVERGTGRFDVKLAVQGLVEVMHKLTGRTAQIKPKQFVTQAMLNWADTAKFDRQIVLADAFSQTTDERNVYTRTNTGRTGLDPSGNPTDRGPTLSGGAAPTVVPTVRMTTAAGQSAGTLAILGMQLRPREPVSVDEGDFGTGSGFGAQALKRQARIAITRFLVRPRGSGDGPSRAR